MGRPARRLRQVVLFALVVVGDIAFGLWSASGRLHVRPPLTWTQAIVICVVLLGVAAISSVVIMWLGRPRLKPKSPPNAVKMQPLSDPTLGPYLRDDSL